MITDNNYPHDNDNSAYDINYEIHSRDSGISTSFKEHLPKVAQHVVVTSANTIKSYLTTQATTNSPIKLYFDHLPLFIVQYQPPPYTNPP